MSEIFSEVYSGLATIGFPLALVSSVVTTFVCTYVISVGIQLRRSTLDPLPVVPGKEQLTPVQKGNILIGAGSLILVVSWLWTWLAYRYKSISAISGFGSVMTMLSSLLHMKSSM